MTAAPAPAPARRSAPPSGAPVGVVGAGTMGAGIAQVAALAGHRVVLLDAAPGRAEAAVGQVGRALQRLTERGRLDPDRAVAAREALVAARSVHDLAGCALVVEAAVERLDVKRRLFATLEDVVAPSCVLATNTSSLSVDDVAAGLRHPGRVVGMHFFNPAPVMRLVEVVQGDATDPAVAARVAEVARAWGKTPVRVASTPGFVVNRVARPFYGEALLALEDGLDAATVDAVLRGSGGFRMGPLELTDLIGQDVNLAATRSVWERLGPDARYAPSPVQEALVAAGSLGRKTGQGFFAHGDGARDADQGPAPATDAPGTPPAPEKVVVRGAWGPWTSLWQRAEEAGVAVLVDGALDRRPGPDGALGSATGGPPARVCEASAELPGGLLVPTDGRTAADHAAAAGCPVVVLDLALDAAAADRFAVAASPGCPRELLDAAVGLLRATGAAVTVLPDRPGLLVARTVAMLVDEAAVVVEAGVAAAADVDVAMRLGAGYPLGPLEWGDRLGPARVAAVLDAVGAATGDPRYRVSRTLRRAATTGGTLRDH
ncbi:3-hydroxyacyl-CoA dehydrogenase [Actinotalea solisilvae]|uniref:3-hydroxyacyl-CoA dehydrogenase n=1 Tax=Actinotalea solisilvae TaxID=2072922 RepID=UPI0018F1C34D|nr:3-hydroxyacyl-CoA dehydrogenase [Actinotalea solisilvae]